MATKPKPAPPAADKADEATKIVLGPWRVREWCIPAAIVGGMALVLLASIGLTLLIFPDGTKARYNESVFVLPKCGTNWMLFGNDVPGGWFMYTHYTIDNRNTPAFATKIVDYDGNPVVTVEQGAVRSVVCVTGPR